MQARNFFKQVFKNLNSKNIFYRYNQEVFTYADLKEFLRKFFTITNYLPKKRNNIYVCCEKSFELYATAISIILSNNIWIPISVNLPLEKMKKQIKESQIDLFILQNRNSSFNKKIIKILKASKIRFITTDDIKQSKKSVLEKRRYKDNDISVIYFTSGSTGIPKGVPISFKNFITSFNFQCETIYKNEKKLVIVDIHDISFVISLNIIIPCIYFGGTIVPAKFFSESVMPLELIRSNKVNCFITVPSTINRILISKQITKKINLKILICCGEPFYFKILDYILKNLKSKSLFNCYGSTELSPWSHIYEYKKKDYQVIRDNGLVPIGQPYHLIKTLIKNDELLISGPNVVNGYLDNKNNEKFVKISNKKYYKTNDICKVKSKNSFIVGRNDTVVKIQGYRVELLEIDINLRKNDDVSNSITFYKKKNEYEVFLFSVVETKKKIDENNLILYMSKVLPPHMIPKKIFVLKEFPINKNGKIDRARLINRYSNEIKY